MDQLFHQSSAHVGILSIPIRSLHGVSTLSERTFIWLMTGAFPTQIPSILIGYICTLMHSRKVECAVCLSLCTSEVVNDYVYCDCVSSMYIYIHIGWNLCGEYTCHQLNECPYSQAIWIGIDSISWRALDMADTSHHVDTYTYITYIYAYCVDGVLSMKICRLLLLFYL